MNIFKGKGKINLTQKICFSGLLIALVAILQKIVAVNYLAGLPFFRISFGAPALIIFASIFLGPFWGALIGFSSDLLGYFAFDASSIVYKPQIGIIYLVLGFVSYYVFEAIYKIKNQKLLITIETISFSALFIGISSYIIFIYECELVFKILIPIGLLILFCGLEIFTLKYKPKEENCYSSYVISFASFTTDFLILVLFGSLMKTWAFMIYYDNVFVLWVSVIISQGLVMFFNAVFNTILLSILFRITKRFITKSEGEKNA